MPDFLNILLLAAVFGVIGVVIARVFGVKPGPIRKDPLDDPRVEWEVWEKTSFIGSTEWGWKVRVGDQGLGNTAYIKLEAVSRAREAARRMLGEGEKLGRTRPCALCGEPSRMGQETDTDQCAELLVKARSELAQLPKAVL